jgi:inorganic pyrophosphatase
MAHPWHGIEARSGLERTLEAFIEMVPGSALKFELDKPSGWLRIDRPQKYSSRLPAMYGLIPQTYCGIEVARRSAEMLGRQDLIGDGDPMDIVVLAQDAPAQGGFLVKAFPVGGLRMVDNGEADDKILAVLEGDPIYGAIQHIGEVPEAIIERLVHYFTTYKQGPKESARKVTIEQIYDHDEAERMIDLSLADYRSRFIRPNLSASNNEQERDR